MSNFITAEEFKQLTDRNSVNQKITPYELQHSIVDFRLKNAKLPYILVPEDLDYFIQKELCSLGYYIQHVIYSPENSNKKKESTIYWVSKTRIW